ncbi:MAG TPA: alpha-amylase family glycosyl hydrolase [Anaerolineaceae bacterium]
MMEFHVSRKARDRYQFDLSLFATNGNVIFANFHGARLFAQKINQKRDLVTFPEKGVQAGHINALGLIDEILHMVIRRYNEQTDPSIMQQALKKLYETIGNKSVDNTLRRFMDEFPPLPVYRQEMTPEQYFEDRTEGIPNRILLLEELVALWLTTSNPATHQYDELFDDTNLRKETTYLLIIETLHQFYEDKPHFGPDHQNLIDMLRCPAVTVPYSLSGQLEYIRERWGSLLGKLLYRILGSLDFIKEEEIQRSFGNTGISPVLHFGQLEAEPERFSQDKDWMPRLVLIAKNSYVWLDQLSKKYQRPINHLDQIPDETLDQLARWGYTGLWLIGLWERSTASQKIKQLCGNPEAVASAYSLANYDIAADLGGEDAYNNLKDRAWKRGIRLASDMVPNHMGLDSDWVIQHPDWFISLDYSPFPAYTFNGPDLSQNPGVGLFLEDHYYTRNDAAVVFKRYDRGTGNTRFIYHGNDGTSMPWNDTAQLNYLKPEVREAIIQTILHVARKFPVIRFDAAMTLAKKHYQRLWFPEPGTGGAIPSRSDYGLTKEQLDAAMPVEFWREVVDRVAQEAPDTLLLAEAFWLMEGFFVRTLGMHRVYNSAFMNMLRNEENANYRQVIKNTLEFDPEILKRYVNFMNNPDERTAVDQFGKGDKYFGVCMLMATLPGLPMFGHGQVEGFTEKYGMEFRHAYWDEQIDPNLVQRHEKEIFPLLHRRYLFAGVDNFLMYDFFSHDGSVNEDVYAYSNGVGNERALVVFQNKFASTQGWIKNSVAYSVKAGPGDNKKLTQKNLGTGLGLQADERHFAIFKDTITGFEYIRSSQELFDKGLFVTLDAYKYHVFIDFREIEDNEWHQFSQLTTYLSGRGVPNIEEALRELFLAPIHQPFRQLVNAPMFRKLIETKASGQEKAVFQPLLTEIDQKSTLLFLEIGQFTGGRQDVAALVSQRHDHISSWLDLSAIQTRYPFPGSRQYSLAIKALQGQLNDNPDYWTTSIGWLFVSDLGRVIGPEGYEAQSRSWMDEWLLGRILTTTAQDLGVDWDSALRMVNTIKVLVTQQNWFSQMAAKPIPLILETWLKDNEVQGFLKVNRYKGTLWFNKEAYDNFLWWMMFLAVMEVVSDPKNSATHVVEQVLSCYAIILELQKAELSSNYQVEKLLEALR